MKIVEKEKVKKQKQKKKAVVKPKKQQVLIVAQEIKYARLLSANENKTRERALKALKKWLLSCFQKGHVFKESDFKRIWKGLFYAMWMSDKPLVQEELCENIAGILDLFPSEQLSDALLLVRVGFQTLATEWYGIDQHRMDKCLMLVRRYLRGSLRCLKRCDWSLDSCQQYADMLGGKDGLLALKTPTYARNAISMILHFIECFLEELAKVSQGALSDAAAAALLRPFCAYMCGGEAPSLCVASRRLLTALIRDSEMGLSYEDKRRAWEKMGCPEGGPDALEVDSDDDDKSDEEVDQESWSLDARAGGTSAVVRPLRVPAKQLADSLRELLASAPASAQRRARIQLERFEQLAANNYPFRITPPPTLAEIGPRPSAVASAHALQRLEEKLAVNADELALRGLSRKLRKRLLAKTRAGLSIVDDVDKFRSSNGDWKVEETATNKKDGQTDNTEKTKNRKRKLEKQNGDVIKEKKVKKNDTQGKKEKKQSIIKVKEDSPKKLKKVEKSNEIKMNGVEKKAKTYNNAPKIIKDKEINKTTQNSIKLEKQAHSNKLEKENTKINKNDKKAQKNKMAATEKIKMAEKSNKKPEKKSPTLVTNKVKNFQKQISSDTPKRVKFVLKNNSMQAPVDYFKSVKQSPNIPFDSSKQPVKTNLKPCTPSPVNPFFKKKLRLK